MNLFLLLGVYTSVSNLVKINEEMRPWECPQTDTHTRTDAKRFYYLSHAICYSYGADKESLGRGNRPNDTALVRVVTLSVVQTRSSKQQWRDRFLRTVWFPHHRPQGELLQANWASRCLRSTEEPETDFDWSFCRRRKFADHFGFAGWVGKGLDSGVILVRLAGCECDSLPSPISTVLWFHVHLTASLLSC